MLALIPPLRLITLGLSLRTTILPSLEDIINEITGEADLDDEPNSHFTKLLGMLDHVEAIGVDPDAVTLISDARYQVKRSIEELEERKRERDEEDDDDTDWSHIVTQKREEPLASTDGAPKRSVFDDVDK